MKFYDIDDLEKKVGVSNKYLLTVLVANWARRVSEQKSRVLEENSEQYLSHAIRDLEKANIKIHLPESRSEGCLSGGSNAQMEG